MLNLLSARSDSLPREAEKKKTARADGRRLYQTITCNCKPVHPSSRTAVNPS